MKELSRRPGDVVYRLRAAFLAIALILLLGAGITAAQIGKLGRAQEASEAAAQSLAIAHSQENRLYESLQRLASVREAATPRELDAVRAAMLTPLDGESAEAASTSQAANSAFEAELVRVVDEVRTSLPVRRTMMSVGAALDVRRSELDELSGAFRQLLEPRLSEVALSLEEALVLAPAAGSERALSSLIDLQTRLTELVLRTDSLVGTARALSFNSVQSGDELDAAPTAYALQSIASILVTLQDASLRTELAVHVRELRDSVLGPSGVFSLLKLQAAGLQQLDAASATQAGSMEQASARIRQVVDDARAASMQAGQRADAARDRAMWTVGLTALAILLSVGLLSFLLVERQIAQRLSLLTRGVLAVAGGKTQATVGVSGDDEIGRMAGAVEIFKLNAAQLKQSNLELEEFAYAASHDMRSPLRAIENLTQWTLEDNQEQLDQEGKDNLQRILDRTGRLDALLRDLLDYARAGHAMPEAEWLDPRELVREVAELLPMGDGFKVAFDGDTAPLHTPGTPLRQVLLNLMSNALKHHDRPVGVITVRLQRRGKRAEFVVEDDGPGIETQYQEQIFKLFETLRSRDEVEGSGLGLALVRKLVVRFGGTIRIESDPSRSRGTRFAFDWPC